MMLFEYLSSNGISSMEQGLGIMHKNVAIESNLSDAWILLDGANQSKKAPIALISINLANMISH